jgi:hypothetical protein
MPRGSAAAQASAIEPCARNPRRVSLGAEQLDIKLTYTLSPASAESRVEDQFIFSIMSSTPLMIVVSAHPGLRAELSTWNV